MNKTITSSRIALDYQATGSRFVQVIEHRCDYTLVYDTGLEHGYDSSTSYDAIMTHAHKRVAEIVAQGYPEPPTDPASLTECEACQ